MSITPIDIAYHRGTRMLEIKFATGETIVLSATKLRVESPSAEVQGHGPATKKIITGKENVAIIRMEPVGNYAVRLIFDDGHDTGLYSWAYLSELGRA
jgi:DUF971 family protein